MFTVAGTISTAQRFGDAMADHIGMDRRLFHVAMEKAGHPQPLLYLDDLDRLCGGDVAVAAASHHESVRDAMFELAGELRGGDRYERSLRALDRYAGRAYASRACRQPVSRELDPLPALVASAA